MQPYCVCFIYGKICFILLGYLHYKKKQKTLGSSFRLKQPQNFLEKQKDKETEMIYIYMI